MKTAKKITIAALLVGALGFAGAAQARPGHGRCGGPKGPHLLGMFRGLELTEAQEIALVRARRSLRSLHESHRAEGKAAAETMLTQLKAETPSKDALYALADQRSASMNSDSRAEIDAFLSVYATLSAEQKTKLTTRMEEHQKRMQENKQKGPPPPPPAE